MNAKRLHPIINARNKAKRTRIVPEKNISTKIIRWIFLKSPKNILSLISKPLIFARKIVNGWEIDWRVIVNSTIDSDKTIQEKIHILNTLGSMPLNTRAINIWKYRYPFWWILAVKSKSTPEILSWAKSAGICFDERLPNNTGFLFAAISANNYESLRWGLEVAKLNPNDFGPDLEPLIIHAIYKSRLDNPILVNLLLNNGATWERNVNNEWQSWYQRKLISEGLSDIVSKKDTENKKRKI